MKLADVFLFAFHGTTSTRFYCSVLARGGYRLLGAVTCFSGKNGGRSKIRFSAVMNVFCEIK